MLTSGTTGEAKAIRFTHGGVQGKSGRNEYAKGSRVAVTARMFCDLGITTGPAFRYLIFMLSRGGTIYYFGASSESTIQAFDLYSIQTMITSPSGVAEYLKFYEQQRAFRCNFESIVASGGLLPKSLSERVLATMCQRLFSSYGATETGTIAFAPAQMIADVPGAVGFVTPGAEVEIVDASDNPLAAGKEGIVRTRTGADGGRLCRQSGRDRARFPQRLVLSRRHRIADGGWHADHPRARSVGAEYRRRQGQARTGRRGACRVCRGRSGRGFHPEERHGRAGAVGGAGVPARSRFGRVAGPLRAAGSGRVSFRAAFIRIDQLPLNAAGKVDRQRLAELMKSGRA